MFSQPDLHARLAAIAVTAIPTPAAVPPPDGDGAANWMLIFPAGSTTARDGRGPFVAGDERGMREIVRRTLEYAGGTDLMVDYDHQSHYGAREGVGGTAKAAGWIREMEVRPSGIWARIEWTGAARAMIRAGEYRYLSPLFTLDDDNRVDLLLNVALTNMPAFDLAVAARMKPKENPMKKLLEALGLKPDAGEADALAALAALKNGKVALAKVAGLADDADSGAISVRLAELAAAAADLKAVAAAAGLAKNSGAEAIVAALKTGDGEETVVALKAELASTAKSLEALKSGIATQNAERTVDAAIREGRVGVKPLRDHYIRRHAASAEGAKEVETEIAALPTLGRSGETIAPPPAADGAVALTAAQTEIVRQMGIKPDDYIKQIKAEREAK